MSTYSNIRSYFLILDKIRKDEPNKKELLDYINGYISMVERTLERHIERLREDFGQKIVWLSDSNSYVLKEDENNIIGTDELLKYLELGTTANLILRNLKEIKDRSKFIEFDGAADLKGVEYLGILLDATVNSNWIEFKYTKFKDGSVSHRKVKPYLLKEYLRRWFVICKDENEIQKTFGIERMDDLNVLSEMFIRDEDWDPKEQFINVVGIFNMEETHIEEVILKFGPKQAKYIKSLPLHKSQINIRENETETIVKLKVQVNYELVQQIMYLGKTVEVLGPKSLKDELFKNFSGALKYYR